MTFARTLIFHISPKELTTLSSCPISALGSQSDTHLGTYCLQAMPFGGIRRGGGTRELFFP